MENLAIDITGKRNAQLAIDQLNEEQAKHLEDDAYLDGWCRSQTMANRMPNLLEERAITSAPSKREIVQELYIRRGFLDLIRTLGLRNYVPKAYRDG